MVGYLPPALAISLMRLAGTLPTSPMWLQLPRKRSTAGATPMLPARYV